MIASKPPQFVAACPPLRGDNRTAAPHNAGRDGDRRQSPPDPLPGGAGPLPASCGTIGPQPPTKKKNGISFFHAFTPPRATAQQRRHCSNGATFLPQRAKVAAATLRAVMEPHRPRKPLEGPLHVLLCWTWPGKDIAYKTTRPDLDNLAKLALDAATKAGYWRDDAQIAMLTLAKYNGPIPGLAMSVTQMESP